MLLFHILHGFVVSQMDLQLLFCHFTSLSLHFLTKVVLVYIQVLPLFQRSINWSPKRNSVNFLSSKPL